MTDMTDAQPQEAQRSLRSTVANLMTIRSWLSKSRRKRNAATKEHRVNDDNVRRVFDISLEQADILSRRSQRSNRIAHLLNFSVSPSSNVFFAWTTLVAAGCVYNLVMIVVMVFEALRRRIFHEWLAVNVFFDGVFFVDLLLQTRLQFITAGVKQKDVVEMLKHRMQSRYFLLDVLCILPTDLPLFLGASRLAATRLNRLLKSYRINDFTTLYEIRSSFPNLFRLLKLIFLCFIIFHWNSCLYFVLSIFYDYEKAEQDDWIYSYDKIPDPVFLACLENEAAEYAECLREEIPIIFPEDIDEDNITEYALISMRHFQNRSRIMRFDNFTRQYGLSFYWSALTLTTLGEQPWPITTFQFSFEIMDTLLGLVIFATIVGDVGSMVTTMNAVRSSFEEMLDGSKGYMISRKVHHSLQQKVVTYFGHMWAEGKMNVDEKEIAQFMPPRLFGQLAVHIHMETLRRVKLFEDCEPCLLYELILRLELQVFSAGDYICRKGEVGKEMYIVKSGFVEVVSEDGTKVFVRLGEGTVFGELSILNIPGNKNGNRRTANVRSVGYCDLYTLQKDDLWTVLHEYPHAKDSLIEKGRALLAKDNLLEEVEDNPLAFEGNLPLDMLVANVQRALMLIDTQLTEEEKSFYAASAATKKRVRALENALAELERAEEGGGELEDDVFH